MADGIEMFTPYSGFTVTAARAENLISAWAYSIFGTGIVHYKHAVSSLEKANFGAGCYIMQRNVVHFILLPVLALQCKVHIGVSISNLFVALLPSTHEFPNASIFTSEVCPMTVTSAACRPRVSRKL